MKNESSYIGIFDSGIGGLTVARSVFRLMPPGRMATVSAAIRLVLQITDPMAFP